MLKFEIKRKKKGALYYVGFVMAALLFLSIIGSIWQMEWLKEHRVYLLAPGMLLALVLCISIVAKYIDGFVKKLASGVKSFGRLINIIVIGTALFIVYVIGIGITALIAKIFRKKFLDRQMDKTEETWWVPLNLSTEKRERYFDLF